MSSYCNLHATYVLRISSKRLSSKHWKVRLLRWEVSLPAKHTYYTYTQHFKWDNWRLKLRNSHLLFLFNFGRAIYKASWKNHRTLLTIVTLKYVTKLSVNQKFIKWSTAKQITFLQRKENWKIIFRFGFRSDIALRSTFPFHFYSYSHRHQHPIPFTNEIHRNHDQNSKVSSKKRRKERNPLRLPTTNPTVFVIQLETNWYYRLWLVTHDGYYLFIKSVGKLLFVLLAFLGKPFLLCCWSVAGWVIFPFETTEDSSE